MYDNQQFFLATCDPPLEITMATSEILELTISYSQYNFVFYAFRTIKA
jgi:hypothetical protein